MQQFVARIFIALLVSVGNKWLFLQDIQFNDQFIPFLTKLDIHLNSEEDSRRYVIETAED